MSDLRYIIRNGEKVLQQNYPVGTYRVTNVGCWHLIYEPVCGWQDKTDIPTVKEEDNE